MGHSSLNVSLTYLRGLEVAELKEKTQKISIVIINWYYPTQIRSVFF
jgi:hypothetical protein